MLTPIKRARPSFLICSIFLFLDYRTQQYITVDIFTNRYQWHVMMSITTMCAHWKRSTWSIASYLSHESSTTQLKGPNAGAHVFQVALQEPPLIQFLWILIKVPIFGINPYLFPLQPIFFHLDWFTVGYLSCQAQSTWRYPILRSMRTTEKGINPGEAIHILHYWELVDIAVTFITPRIYISTPWSLITSSSPFALLL